MPTTRSFTKQRRRWQTINVKTMAMVMVTLVIVIVWTRVGAQHSQQQQQQQVLMTHSTTRGISYHQRIVAVADIHGDVDALREILIRAQLINERDEWIGGNDVFVQTGDNVDRGPSLIEITRLYDHLRPLAQQQGGDVVNLYGNHEIMNALGDWRYVTNQDIATFGGANKRREILSKGWLGQTWRNNYTVMARVPMRLHFNNRQHDSNKDFEDVNPKTNDSSAIHFVHGGLTASYLDALDVDKRHYIGPIQQINAIGHSVMLDAAQGHSPSTRLQRDFWSSTGPMWARDYALDDNEDRLCLNAQRVARQLQVRHLVMGHTPNFEGIVSRCQGLVLLIDTGISRAYGGAHSALEFNYSLEPDTFKRDNMWTETEVVKALYTRGRESEMIVNMTRIVDLSTQ
ncbi:hypothetical protein OIO90_003151 [Microbotryomycetes sp. JL221]|nr:hypothetical protein OIO90_003151 [Microbotryomycetes sp. JL221]